MWLESTSVRLYVAYQVLVLQLEKGIEMGCIEINSVVYTRCISNNDACWQNCSCSANQLGAAANFDDLAKFGDRRQIRRSRLFIKLAFDVIFVSHPITQSSGPGPTRLRARARNRDRLENRSHVVPKTEFQDGGGRTRIFTHKITILA